MWAEQDLSALELRRHPFQISANHIHRASMQNATFNPRMRATHGPGKWS